MRETVKTFYEETIKDKKKNLLGLLADIAFYDKLLGDYNGSEMGVKLSKIDSDLQIARGKLTRYKGKTMVQLKKGDEGYDEAIKEIERLTAEKHDVEAVINKMAQHEQKRAGCEALLVDVTTYMEGLEHPTEETLKAMDEACEKLGWK